MNEAFCILSICYVLYCLQHVIWKIENCLGCTLKKVFVSRIYKEYLQINENSLQLYGTMNRADNNNTGEELHDQSAILRFTLRPEVAQGLRKLNLFHRTQACYHLLGGSQQSATPDQRNLTPFSCLHRHFSHVVNKHETETALKIK